MSGFVEFLDCQLVGSSFLPELSTMRSHIVFYERPARSQEEGGKTAAIVEEEEEEEASALGRDTRK